eukprot:3307613-Rhodomonas_salina.1
MRLRVLRRNSASLSFCERRWGARARKGPEEEGRGQDGVITSPRSERRLGTTVPAIPVHGGGDG